MRARILLTALFLTTTFVGLTHALERPDIEFKIFQFPPDRIPRVDGKADDWEMVPSEYVIGTDQLVDTVHGSESDPKDLDVRVRVGWVKGMNQLWFLYEARDDYWDFSRPGLKQDIFEVVVDGDLSGGPLIKHFHPHFGQATKVRRPEEAHFSFHGVHAQNYHIFTPARDKDWTMVWGCQPWIKDLPYANAAYSYDFEPAGSGKLVLEFWITPFDHAPADPERAVVSRLRENQLLGLSWAILDYDDVKEGTYQAFSNLSHKSTMYGDASDLCAFRLMPPQPVEGKPIAADWSFQVVDAERRVAGFTDRSAGEITSWHWDFGDGTTSTERHPIHTYSRGGEFVVILDVEGPKGKARRAKVWDLVFK